MDQYLNNRQNEILWRLLANPADNGSSYGSNLQQLVKDFPQSGLLQALLARANGGENLPHAAAAFNTRALYVMMNASENLAGVSEDQIVQDLNGTINYAGKHDEPVMELNDFSDGKLKDILGFEPAEHEEEHPEGSAEKVVVGDDERHEVETIEAVQDYAVAEETIPEESEATEELPETETAPDTIVPEEIEEPAAITEAFAEAEMAAEIPAAVAEEHIAAEVPAEDHRAGIDLSPYEEEIIEAPQGETEGPLAEIPHEDLRTDVYTTPYEEEVTGLPEVEATKEEPAVHPDIAEPVAEDQPQETIEPRHYGSFGVIDDEVFDEIADIGNISFAFAPKTPEIPVAPEPPSAETPAENVVESVQAAEAKPEEHDTRDEIGRLMSQELISADYLAFESSRQHEHDAEATEEPEVFTAEAEVHPRAVGEAAEPQAGAETQDVSKYHDEKMPYTFMWWLDKTRKEHAGIYQPFKLDTTQAIRHTADDTLQQQYYENIFHINTIDELDKNAAKQQVEFDLENKEDRIIQKFIVEEPQIGPPAGDKLDNENKAKRSSEDQDEMVTETLAKIYIDQMLYPKAINTYKKLMLKFPEKSRYFADQIEILERKIN